MKKKIRREEKMIQRGENKNDTKIIDALNKIIHR